MGAAGALILALARKRISWTLLKQAMATTGKLSSFVVFILVGSTVFGLVFRAVNGDLWVEHLLLGLPGGVIGFLLVVNLILLVAGNFMEPTGIILILAPIFFPIATQLGIDPIHLGIIMVVNMEIGMVTPPVGLNLFVTSGVTGMSLVQVARAALPWLTVLLVFLVMVTYIPQISLFLPDLIMGKQ